MEAVVKLLPGGNHHRTDVGLHLRPRDPGLFVGAVFVHVLAPGREHGVGVAVEQHPGLSGVVHRIYDVGRVEAVDERRHDVERHVLYVEVEDRLAPAPADALLERRNPELREVAFAVPEAESPQFVVGVVRDAARTVGGAVDRGVVHQYDHAVFGQPGVDFEERRHHREGLLERFDTVLGIARDHAAAVSADDYGTVGRVAEPFVQFGAGPDVRVMRSFGSGSSSGTGCAGQCPCAEKRVWNDFHGVAAFRGVGPARCPRSGCRCGGV